MSGCQNRLSMDPWEPTFILQIGPKKRDMDIIFWKKSIFPSDLGCKNFAELQRNIFRGGVSRELSLPQSFSITTSKWIFCLLMSARHKNTLLQFIWFCSPQLDVPSINQDQIFRKLCLADGLLKTSGISVRLILRNKDGFSGNSCISLTLPFLCK